MVYYAPVNGKMAGGWGGGATPRLTPGVRRRPGEPPASAGGWPPPAARPTILKLTPHYGPFAGR